MILLHAIKMTLQVQDKIEPVHYNEDVTFYTDKTAMVGISQLAELQRLKQELREEHEPVEKYHLLHISEIHTPWFNECATDLQALNGIALDWQVQQLQIALESKTNWYAKCQTS